MGTGSIKSIVALAILTTLTTLSHVDSATEGHKGRISGSFEERKGCPHVEGDALPPGRVNSTEKLANLRGVMREHRDMGFTIDAYIITSNDEHQSEYIAARDRRLEFVTGFSGSNGVAVVTAGRAALWTDGRYVLQADVQLDCNWELMTRHDKTQWLSRELPGGARVGADPRLLSHHEWDTLQRQLGAVNITLVKVSNNLVDIIWKTGRPAYNSYEAYVHNITFSGLGWIEKVEQVRDELKLINADAMVVTSLEEIAWLFNIRGYDLEYTPVLRAYAILSMKEIFLFAHETKISPEIKEYLRMENCYNQLCVTLRPYRHILGNITDLSQYWKKVLLPAQCVYDQGVSHAVYTAVRSPEKRHLQISPILLLKARKNKIEAQGMRVSHIRDAAAFCDFMAYFERKMEEGHTWTEMEVAQIVDRFRGEQLHSKGPSFTTIAGYGPNAALPHYVPTNATNLVIGNTSTLVLDSGGQYYDGTTDVTRTFHFGTPTEFQKEVYTRILMGSIQLATLVFPSSVKMTDVDVLARGPLWEAGLDYDHGTGHGIGSFLGVHESPINVIYNNGNFTFEKGYFFSDEPGYYEEGDFGVRLENILEVEDRPRKHNPGQKFYGFRSATLIPYEPKLINFALLNKNHIEWLNDYNNMIQQKVGTVLNLQNRKQGYRWLMSKTSYIPDYSKSRGIHAAVSAVEYVIASFVCLYVCI